MGKIRVKTIGEETSSEQKEKKKQKKEQKKLTKAPGLGGGEKITAVGPSMEEVLAQSSPTENSDQKQKKTKKDKFKKEKTLSQKYSENLALLKKDTLYPLAKAVDLLMKFKKAKFDETVELHVNLKEKGISGQVILPHGTGKKIRIKVADEALISQIEKGVIDFDVLISSPQLMPKLAKVARILGPKGLMPNPKAGTITTNPDELIEKLSKGQVSYKTETGAPILHLSVGKVSFTPKQLEENITTVLSHLPQNKIQNVTLKSSMSPGIKVAITNNE